MASEAEKHRRSVPKEKRRHFTISSSRPLMLETRDTGLEEVQYGIYTLWSYSRLDTFYAEGMKKEKYVCLTESV